MLTYCIILWIVGLGFWAQYIHKEVEKEDFRWPHMFGYLILEGIFPFIVPIIVGWTWSQIVYFEEKEQL